MGLGAALAAAAAATIATLYRWRPSGRTPSRPTIVHMAAVAADPGTKAPNFDIPPTGGPFEFGEGAQVP